MVDRSLFRFSHLIEVRFADLDLLGHVNHAAYFTYMETARVHYVESVLVSRGDSSQNKSCDLCHPYRWHPVPPFDPYCARYTRYVQFST